MKLLLALLTLTTFLFSNPATAAGPTLTAFQCSYMCGTTTGGMHSGSHCSSAATLADATSQNESVARSAGCAAAGCNQQTFTNCYSVGEVNGMCQCLAASN